MDMDTHFIREVGRNPYLAEFDQYRVIDYGNTNIHSMFYFLENKEEHKFVEINPESKELINLLVCLRDNKPCQITELDLASTEVPYYDSDEDEDQIMLMIMHNTLVKLILEKPETIAMFRYCHELITFIQELYEHFPKMRKFIEQIDFTEYIWTSEPFHPYFRKWIVNNYDKLKCNIDYPPEERTCHSYPHYDIPNFMTDVVMEVHPPSFFVDNFKDEMYIIYFIDKLNMFSTKEKLIIAERSRDPMFYQYFVKNIDPIVLIKHFTRKENPDPNLLSMYDPLFIIKHSVILPINYFTNLKISIDDLIEINISEEHCNSLIAKGLITGYSSNCKYQTTQMLLDLNKQTNQWVFNGVKLESINSLGGLIHFFKDYELDFIFDFDIPNDNLVYSQIRDVYHVNLGQLENNFTKLHH